jgi:hypothetical protein
MRLGLYAIIVTLAAPVSTWAQTRDPVPSWSVTPPSGGPAIPPRYGPRSQGSLPQIGLALPPIGLPLPPIGLRPPDQKRDGGRHQRGRSRAPRPVMLVMVPQFAVAAEPPVPMAVPVEQPPSKGSLVLHVEPAATQVFVDGYYAGAAADFGGQRGGAFLDAGPHTVELIAPDHEPVSFDVKISANQAITYRHEMKRTQVPLPVSPSPKTPTTFYLIPGCYMGNVPPRDAALPSTCDLARTQTFRN